MSNAARKGCRDIWNSYMVKGASWDKGDIPFCPTTACAPPEKLISFSRAKTLCNKAKARGMDDFHIDAFVHFYIDDQKFAGPHNSIWSHPEGALEIISRCDGMITPDFSTYADFPDPIKRDATYKMRAFGYYAGTLGNEVVNNVRWGTPETWGYSFNGIEKCSLVAIGTVASSIRLLDNRPLFEEGLHAMVETLSPKAIIVYGSANNKQLAKLHEQGIEVIAFPSETSIAFKKVMQDE